MTDRIVGQPTNLTTVSDSGIGGVRVTLAPWELDWEFFDGIAVDSSHFLANITTAVSGAIINKGGSENLGYWFDIDVVFPSANWNTGNRITPQRQAAINQYNTFAAAVAAMAMHDTFLVWYQNTANRRIWNEVPGFAGIAGNLWGMLSRGQIFNGRGAVGYRISGNLLAQNQQVVWTNLSAGPNSSACFSYQAAAGQAGAGLKCKRCFATPLSLGFYALNHNAGTVIWENCLALKGPSGFAAGIARSCTAVLCVQGFAQVEADLRNLLAIECSTCFIGGALAGAQNCADTDGTLPVHATNLRNQDPRTQVRPLYDLASPGNKKFEWGMAPHYDSVLRGAGVAIAGVTRDYFGVARPNPPAIGAVEPWADGYAPGAELIRSLRRKGVVA